MVGIRALGVKDAPWLSWQPPPGGQGVRAAYVGVCQDRRVAGDDY